MAIMYIIPFILWFIAIEVLYHTVFTVYYFNLGKGCLSEVVASFVIAFILTCLTYMYWYVVVIVLILIGLVASNKSKNIGPLVVCIIISIIFSLLAIRLNKKIVENKKNQIDTEDTNSLRTSISSNKTTFEDTTASTNKENNQSIFQSDNQLESSELEKINEENSLQNESTMANIATDSKETQAESEGSPEEYILYASNKRVLQENEYKQLNAADLRLAINEIYARHGRQYDTTDLNEYFSQKSWYHPQYSKSEFDQIENQILNSYEKENLKLFSCYRKQLLGQIRTILGVYETKFGDEGGAQLVISGVDPYYHVFFSGSTSGTGEYEGDVEKIDNSIYTVRSYDYVDALPITFILNADGTLTVTEDNNSYYGIGFPGFMGTYKKIS